MIIMFLAGGCHGIGYLVPIIFEHTNDCKIYSHERNLSYSPLKLFTDYSSISGTF